MENTKTDRELGWDDTIQNDGDFEILPDGKYQFKVMKLERARFAGSAKLPACNQANVTVNIFDDLGTSRDMEEKLKLHSKMEWILCAFFRSIGLRGKDEALQMKWGEIIGKTGWCEVGHRAFTSDKGGSKGETITVNQISKWLAPEDAPTPAQATFTPGEF